MSTRSEQVKALTDQLEQGVKDVFLSDNYLNFLRTMAKFHSYSVNNELLIHLQCPNASYVAGYTTWRDKFHRHVKANEQGIRILAPAPYRCHEEVDDPITHELTVRQITVMSYRTTVCFDYSQTEGEPLLELIHALTGDVFQYEDLLAAIRRVSPAPIDFTDVTGQAYGYFSPNENKIVIQSGLSQVQTVKTALHELTHSLLHSRDVLKENQKDSANLNSGSSALQEEIARERIVRDKILSSYNFTFPNGPCKSDGCYHLHLHNAEGKTISRTVKAKTIEELKDKIYKYHKDMLPSSLTFAEMFQQAQQDVFRYVKQDSDAYHSKLNSFNRRQQLFDRFITGTSWEKKKITTFTVQDIDDLILYNLQRYDLRTRALSSLKSIIRMTFDYAVSHGCIRHNPYPDLDSRRYRDLLVPDAPVRERGYTEDELNRILNYLHQKEESDPRCTTSWALELVVICALRRGEVPPLRLEDIQWGRQPGLYLHRTLLEVRNTDSDNKIGYYPVEHTKTHKDRLYPMSDQLKEFLDRYLPIRNAHYPTSPFLFPARRWDNKNHRWEEGGMITDQTIPSFYSRMCTQLGIKRDSSCIRGTHAFRRNAITDTMVASGGNIDLTAQIFGNSPETIRKAYLLDMNYDAKLAALNGCQQKKAMVV